MTEEELRKKIIEIFWEFYNNSLPPDQFADEILTLIREAGWRSRDFDYRCPYCKRVSRVMLKEQP